MKKLLTLLAVVLLAVGVNAQTVSLYSGIGSVSYDVSGTTINIYETWTIDGPGFLEISGLSGSWTNYTVNKYITNNTGTDWDHMALELLDPIDNNDNGDNPTESWVPAGFTHSNDYDGLNFAQGVGSPDIARTSDVFASNIADEVGGRDYVDFFNGIIAGDGGTGMLSFGIRDNWGNNQPFLLVQRPNEYTGGDPVIPEPTTIILFGLGMAGVAIRNRFRK